MAAFAIATSFTYSRILGEVLQWISGAPWVGFAGAARFVR